jgi:hypothetical protein
MKDSKTKEEESTHLTYTGLNHSCCHTYLDSQFRRGRQCLSGNLLSMGIFYLLLIDKARAKDKTYI